MDEELRAEKRGDPGLDALIDELNALFACPQVKVPEAGQHVLFNSDKDLPPERQRPNMRGVRCTLWCCGQKVKRCNKKTDGDACPSWADRPCCSPAMLP